MRKVESKHHLIKILNRPYVEISVLAAINNIKELVIHDVILKKQRKYV